VHSFPKLLLCLALCVTSLGLTAQAADAAIVSGAVPNSAGYRVVLVKANGRAQYRTLGRTGAFRFSGTSAQLRGGTLHLVRANGRYFGPVVLKSVGTSTYLQLSGIGGSLGSIQRLGGFAKAPATTRASLIDLTRVARGARTGAPVGAGRFGFVARRFKFKSDATITLAPGPDSDLDGVANVFDVDDDGDLTLDPLDRDQVDEAGLRVWFYSVLNAQVQDSRNVNMGATVTQAEIDALLREWQGLTFSLVGPPSEVAKVTSVNVDCFALSYCRRTDGTGVMIDAPSGFAWGDPWTKFDPDGNGLPNMWNRTREWFASIWTRADQSAIHIGDTFRWDIARGSAMESRTSSLNYYFVTTPALKSHTSGGTTTNVAYPVGEGGVGTFENPAPLAGTSVALQLWRPQRTAIANAETGAYRDMGGLFWGVELEPAGTGEVINCGQSTISALSPTLRIQRDVDTGLFLFDSAGDAAPDPARTIGFTVDLAACLAAANRPASGTYTMSFRASDRSSNTSVQRFTVRLP
jgi:hypothetical protein